MSFRGSCDTSPDRTDRLRTVHRSCAALGLLLVACGSRPDLDVSGAFVTDAGRAFDGPHRVSPVDATVDAQAPFDATFGSDGAVDAGSDGFVPVDAGSDGFVPFDAAVEAGADSSCTPSTPVVTTAACGIPGCCKFGVMWTCGSQALSVGGGCQVTAKGYEGVCYVNGSPESMFSASATSCLCNDAGALAAYVQSLCDVSPPPTPP